MTYNKYIIDGIQDGTITQEEVDGVRVYKVRKPKPNEEIVRYINFSSIIVAPINRKDN
jgi:hypothetical protein